MALTFTLLADKAKRLYAMIGGARLYTQDITIGAGADYSSGFDLGGNLTKFGARKIISVLECSIRSSAGSLRLYVGLWDANTQKLRFVKNSAAAGLFTEIVGGDLTANDILRVVALVV